MGTVLYTLAWLFAPHEGLVARWFRPSLIEPSFNLEPTPSHGR
jgi:hypothetical protein